MPKTKIEVRDACEADLEEAEGMVSAAFESLRATYRPRPEAVNRTSGFRPSLSRIVSLAEGKIVGTAGYREKGDFLSIIGLGVHPEFRRLGVARRMVETLMDRARETGALGLALYVIKETGNCHVFSRLGFRAVAERPAADFESDVFETLTEVRMELMACDPPGARGSRNLETRNMAKYHMRKKEQEITDPSVLEEILRAGKFAVAALCRADEPYAVSLSYGYDAEGKALYFHCAKAGLKIDFVNENPAACLTVIEDRGYKKGECEQGYRSIVLRGEMHLVEDLGEKKHAMEVLLHHLEEDPAPIRERNLKDDKAYLGVGILRFDIREMTGKEGS